MKKRMALIVSVTLLTAVSAMAQNPPATPEAAAPTEKPAWNDIQRYSYAVGVNVGSGMRVSGQEFDMDVFIQGVQDSLNSKSLKLTREELKDAVMAMRAKITEQERKKAEENLAAQEAFLTENAKKEGVTTLPSGLQYKVITEGTGPSPQVTDRVKVNYRGTFPSGEEFDSSYKRGIPADLQINKTIKGWQEALPLMKVGDKWELYIPAQLAYGQMGQPGKIPPNQMLIFEIELLEILPPETAPAAPPTTPPPAPPAPAEAAQGSS